LNEHVSLNASFAALESRMKQLAADDGDTYLPNVLPCSPADYIFIGMEPSLGSWAGNAGSKAEEMLRDGFRNFHWSMDDFVLHHSIERFLPGKTYHITDVSKGAMMVQSAKIDRTNRYANWLPLLVDELKLLASANAIYFSVGRAVIECLQQLGFPFPLHQVLHFSSQASPSRKRALQGREKEFQSFEKTISANDILATAGDRLDRSGMSTTLKERILSRLSRSGPLSESRKMLAFTYKTQFERVLRGGVVSNRLERGRNV